MLLIFPRIEISRAHCIERVATDAESRDIYTDDPVRMAVLWRGENAKTLHVVDKDGFNEGTSHLCNLIGTIVKAVDIPIQVGGGLRTYEDIKALFDAGVYRVVVGTVSFEQPDLMARLLKEFGSRRIAVSIETIDGKPVIGGRRRVADISPIEHALQMKKLGVSRITYATFRSNGAEEELRFDALKEMAIKTGVRITACGGTNDYRDLLRLQELEKYGVDSVILGKPLYENRFACQKIWRLNERYLTDLGPTRRI